MNDKQVKEPIKSKKEFKWYTYVDTELNTKLKEFMEQYNINNQAKMIRDSVSYYLDYAKSVIQKNPENNKYNDKTIDDFIRGAIDSHDLGSNFYEELKQKLSPLKVATLMLNNFAKDPDKLNESIEDVKDALQKLEISIKRRFEEPKILRYLKKFDILYIEDNELERKTVDTYFKTKDMEIITVETAEEGFEILKSSTPQVILLDIDLKTSNINGVKMSKKLKSKMEYKNIPIILISAVVSEKQKEDVLTVAKADEIIVKPINKLTDLDILSKYII